MSAPPGPPPPGPPPPAVNFTLKKPLKITKVVRKPVEEAPPEPQLSPEEEEKLFVDKFKDAASSLSKLGATADFSAVLQLLAEDVAATCFAFDYDQTLHLRENYRGRSLELLKRLQALGVPFCIVTAARPSIGSVKALAEELQELHLDPFFKTTALDPQRALERIATWGDDAALSPEMLQKKLMLLFALCTDRRPADLVRIGHSNAQVADDGASATYRLQRGPTDWSAEQTLESPALVNCLHAFLERIRPTRPPPAYREIDLEKDMPEPIVAHDRLFLDPAGKAYSVESFEAAVQPFLEQECGYPEWQVSGLMREPAQELNVKGIQMARYGNLICAKYNKAEAIEFFLQELPHVKRVVFVDDNFDNVFNVFLRFAESSSAHVVRSIWFEEPADGQPEKYDARRVQLGGLIMRPLPALDAVKPVALKVTVEGVGVVLLEQEDMLTPLRISVDGDAGSEPLVLYFSETDKGEPWNPLGAPLDPLQRPDCLGVTLPGSTFAFSLLGDLSVGGKYLVIKRGASIIASAKVQ